MLSVSKVLCQLDPANLELNHMKSSFPPFPPSNGMLKSQVIYTGFSSKFMEHTANIHRWICE